MTMWSDDYKHLLDVWGNPTTDGIFTKLQEKPDIPWKSENIPQVLDLTYYYNHSGNKIVSPLIDNMIGDNDTLTEDQKQTLADIVYGICNENWKRVWEALFADYNPIWNVDADITDTETRDLTGTEKGTTGQKQTGTDTLGKTGKISTTESGSDSIEHTGTDTDTESGSDSLIRTGTDTHTESGTDNKTNTGTDTHALSGTDSVSNTGTDTHALSGTDTQKNTGTQKNENKNDGSKQTTENDTYGFNSESPVNADKTVVTVNQDVIDTRTDNLVQTVEHGQKDTETQNLKQTTEYGRSDKETQDLTESTEYGHTDTETLDTTDTTNYGKTDTRTLNLKDTTIYGKDTSEGIDTTDTTTYNNSVDVTKDNTTTDKGTIAHKTVRQGNIGVTTTQQMITEEMQLRKEMFYERVFSDIDRYLTIGIY